MEHYKLLTPGPLTTSEGVRRAMLKDWCTWDEEYKILVQSIRGTLLNLAEADESTYTTVLMQGSGTFCVESVIGSILGEQDTLLVLANGAYGQRIAEIARYLKISYLVHDFGELDPVDPAATDRLLKEHPEVTHVAFVHCETTTGMLNPLEEITGVIAAHNRKIIVDAMSSFGGIPIPVAQLQIDILVSSANKCIQGVPGFGFILIKKELLTASAGNARSLSLDLYAQWHTMENAHGKWRFTSPTHTVRAFYQALLELEEEGGVKRRHERYLVNQHLLVSGMKEISFQPLLDDGHHSPIITTFLYPEAENVNFEAFYYAIKKRGFVIYPGKVTHYNCFRIGNIGEIYPEDIRTLLSVIKEITQKERYQ